MKMTRGKAIEHLKNIAIYSVQDGYTDEARQALDMAIKALEEPERKKGTWGADGECPFCGYLRQWEDDNFCANCGADMRGDSNE